MMKIAKQDPIQEPKPNESPVPTPDKPISTPGTDQPKRIEWPKPTTPGEVIKKYTPKKKD